MIVTFLGLKMLASERNTICFLVLGLGAFTLLVASLGLWIADQPTSSRPCCSKLYSWMLLMLVLPQLAGAMLFTHPKFLESTYSNSCDYLEQHSWASTASTGEQCTDQKTCLSLDGCSCACDEKCRTCYQEIKVSQEFVEAHAKVCSYLFAGFAAIELLAWGSIQLLNRFELEELIDMTEKMSTGDQNTLLHSMKAKYRSKGHLANSSDDPLAANTLLGADDDDEIYII